MSVIIRKKFQPGGFNFIYLRRVSEKNESYIMRLKGVWKIIRYCERSEQQRLAVRKESTAREYVDYHGVSKYNDGW